jgi:hypothetical protein
MDISVDTFANANLEKGVENIEKGAHTASNIGMSIIQYGAIIVGAILLLYGLYLAASRDTREEGKLKNGVKLAIVGVLLLSFGFVLLKITGTDVIAGYSGKDLF